MLGTLLKSGVPLVAALAVVREVLSNQVLARAVGGLAEAVKRGAGLHKPMAEAGTFPPLAIHMVRVGEETGRLEEMLLTSAPPSRRIPEGGSSASSRWPSPASSW